MHKIAITGATGFVGRNLVEKLLKENNNSYEIALIVRDENKAKTIFENNESLIYIDINSVDYKKDIKNFNPRTVIHLASFLTSDDSEKSLENILDVNLKFGTNILNALEETDLEYFINFGTFAEYYENDEILDSAYLYSASKTAFRSIIKYYQKKMKFKWFNIIPYTIYGGKDTQKKVIDYIINSIFSVEPIKMSKGEQILDFIHVEDVTDFVLQLLDKSVYIDENFIEFKLGTGVGTSIRDLANIIERIFEKETNIAWGSLEYRKMDIMKAIANVSSCEQYLNYKTKISLCDGVNRIKIENYSDK